MEKILKFVMVLKLHKGYFLFKKLEFVKLDYYKKLEFNEFEYPKSGKSLYISVIIID